MGKILHCVQDDKGKTAQQHPV